MPLAPTLLRNGRSGRLAILDFISSLFLASVFLYAGVDKLFHYGGFIRALESYVILPPALAPYTALAVIAAEIWTAAGLLIVRLRHAAALSSSLLLSVFTLALAINYIVAPNAICGCWFTITLSQGTEHHILQNLLMLGLSISLYLTYRRLSLTAKKEISANS